MNKTIKKLLGHKYDTRFKWGEFNWHPKFNNWRLGFRLTDRYSEITDMLVIEPLLCSAYIYLPTKICPLRKNGDMSDGKSYGFYLYESVKNFTTLVLRWGKWSNHIEMPWTYKWYSTEILNNNNNCVYYEDTKTNKLIDWSIRNKTEEFWKKETSKIYDYTYTKKNQEVQKRRATVFISRRTWTMRWFPWIKLIKKSIDVTFNEEVGEGSGSWKGGCTGCEYDMLEGETSLQTLRRMEKERIFKR